MSAEHVDAICTCAHWLGEGGAVGVEHGGRGDVVAGSALPHDTQVTGLAMSPCGRLLVSCTRAGVLYVWETARAGGEGEAGVAGGDGCGKGSLWRRRARWCDTRQTNEVASSARTHTSHPHRSPTSLTHTAHPHRLPTPLTHAAQPCSPLLVPARPYSRLVPAHLRLIPAHSHTFPLTRCGRALRAGTCGCWRVACER